MEKEEINKKILEEIDLYYSRNLNNYYFSEDFKDFIKELEKKYNCEIDTISYQIKFN